MGQAKSQFRVLGEKKPQQPETGGREFGQVIEPMQAEMASENDGLTEKQPEKKNPAKNGRAA